METKEEYPKMLYRKASPTEKPRQTLEGGVVEYCVVKSVQEHDALSKEWRSSPLGPWEEKRGRGRPPSVPRPSAPDNQTVLAPEDEGEA